jgi:hypothetical protein
MLPPDGHAARGSSMTDQGGGPVKYIAMHPIPEPCGPFTVPIPPNVLDGVSEWKRQRIGVVQLRFARDVSELLAKSYSEIAAIVEDEAGRDG